MSYMTWLTAHCPSICKYIYHDQRWLPLGFSKTNGRMAK